MTRRVFLGSRVVLPGQNQPQPATIVVDSATGKITDVQRRLCARNEFPAVEDIDWIDAGDSVIIPGIVE